MNPAWHHNMMQGQCAHAIGALNRMLKAPTLTKVAEAEIKAAIKQLEFVKRALKERKK